MPRLIGPAGKWNDRDELARGVFVTKHPPTGIIGAIERRTVDRVFLDLVDATTLKISP